MQNKPENQVNAGFFVRLAAYLVDRLIVGAALLLIRIPLAVSSWFYTDNIFQKDIIFRYSAADILYYILTAAYFVLLTYYTGATVGKKMFHLRVVSTEGRKLTFFEVVFRETVGRFLSKLVLYVGYIMVGVHKEKHGLHDMLSDTEVIYYHEQKVAVETPVAKREMAETVYSPAGYMVPTYTQESDQAPTLEEVTVSEETIEKENLIEDQAE